MATVLIVDDDAQLRKSFEKLLTDQDHYVICAGSGEKGCEIIRSTSVELAIMDVRLPGMDGLEAFQKIKQYEPKLPVIIMTAFGTTDTAIEATKLGAFDYVLKPFAVPEMFTLIDRALEAGRFMRTPVGMDSVPEPGTSETMIGKSAAMQEIYKAIGRTAPTDTTVLIRGESGTGKELVARALYQHSRRADKPFLVINCVAIPETLLEAELFGFERGSFTGAVKKRVGKIEQAHQGTVFLDEIGDMPVGTQAKLLRLLQEKTIERIGGNNIINADVRIVAATNRSLEKLMEKGLFREDLYYRLNVVTITLPPLKDRLNDVPLLADYFLKKFSAELSLQNPGIAQNALSLLKQFPWPGNVRELANTIQKALIFSRGCPLDADDIAGIINKQQASTDTAADEEALKQWIRNLLRTGNGRDVFSVLLDRFACIVIQEVLGLTKGNRTQAAKLLGLSRPTLLTKIEKYGLHIETVVKKE